MEVVQFVPQLEKALWNLKLMYDQHVDNGNEIKELQSFIQDYDRHIPILRERFQEGGGNVMGIATFKNLERDVMGATNKLERWLRSKSFFQVYNSAERMQKLEKLHSKVMVSVQRSLGIVNLSMLLDVQATQSTILESNVELKSLLITSIGSVHGMLPAKVRDEVVEASTSSFADPKFWEDILGAVDNHNVGLALVKDKNVYEDPITSNLMIDPILASDGNTYCRWTIIDNNLTTNPFNVDEDLTIVIDNLNFRRGLFEEFPGQAQIFCQRRKQYRNHALSLRAQGLWGNAILALHYVLQWDKHDVECIEALEQVQRALHKAKEKYLQPSIGLSNEMKRKTLVSHRVKNLELPQLRAPKLWELARLTEDKHKSSTDSDWELARSNEMTDITVNYKNNIIESSSLQIDSFEREHSETSEQFGGGPKRLSTREIHQIIDVPIQHEEHSIKDIQADSSKGTLVLKHQRMSGKVSGMSSFVQKLMSSVSNEKKEKKVNSSPMKFYGGKLKPKLSELEILRRFSSSDIKRMTNNFSEESIIREEQSYTAYNGIQVGTSATIAIMKFKKDFVEAFKMEIEMVSRLHHKYVVALVGYCLEPDPILIYEAPNNFSLFDHVHGTSARGTLDWRRRLHIALTAAEGLKYLHTGCTPRIIHRNVKSTNILLTPEFDAKVANFELAKLMSEAEDTVRVVTDVMGSIGYLDPEYFSTGSVSAKSDVYSFGVVLLELITGKLPYDQSLPTMGDNRHFVHWVRQRLQDNDIDSILAPIVKASNPNMEAVWEVADIAMQSIEPKAVHRPTMAQVVQELQCALTLEVYRVNQ